MKTRSLWLAVAAIASVASTVHADLADDVARARALAWKHAVPVETLDADAFAARARGSDAPPDVWGVARDPGELDAIFDGTEVIAKAGAPESAIAAALDRALIEQHAAPVATSDPEARRVRELLETGDAEALAIDLALARAGKPPPWDDAQVVAQLATGNVALAYVARLRKRGWRAVDAALRKPPATTADLLGQRIAPVAIAGDAPAGWTLASSDEWGELGTRAFFTAHGLADVVADEAAAGWLGDRVLTCTRGVRAIGLWRSEWATEDDAERARAAIGRAFDAMIFGGELDPTHWLAIDGSVAFVERRGTSVLAMVGVPAYEADDVAAEAWAGFTRTSSARAR
ncbi:MAG TPA: hypothetical protein VGL61_14385 [Kofleriaceae bacterium]